MLPDDPNSTILVIISGKPGPAGEGVTFADCRSSTKDALALCKYCTKSADLDMEVRKGQGEAGSAGLGGGGFWWTV